MEEIRHQKTIKYKRNLSTKLLLLQNDENALTTFLHSTDDILYRMPRLTVSSTVNVSRNEVSLKLGILSKQS